MNKYYEILGLKPGCSKSDIKKAYRKLAMQYHPDKNQGDASAEETFKKVSEAYQMLMDPSKIKERPAESGHRTKWHERGWKEGDRDANGNKTYTQAGFSSSEFAKMYNDLFGKRPETYKQGFNVGDDRFGFGKVYDSVPTDKNIYADFNCTINELFNGRMLEYTVTRKIICRNCYGKPRVCSACGGAYVNKTKCGKCGGTGVETCDTCNGAGYTTITKDIKINLDIRKTHITINKGENGQHYATLRFNSMGNSGLDIGGLVETGDLFFRLRISGVPAGVHVDYNGDITHEIKITMVEALSDRINITTADGAQRDISMRRMNETGVFEFAIPGAGVMNKSNEKRGDYIFKVRVMMPDFSLLDEKDKSALLEIFKKIQ